jgi:psiF repeat-containing protein
MIRAAAAVACALLAGSALAQDAKSAKQRHLEERSTVCGAQADDRHLRGATRRAYMQQCLRGGSTPQIAAQQEKILECTEQAEDQSLEARERRRFMTECLRG